MNPSRSSIWARLTTATLLLYVIALATSTHWPNLAQGPPQFNDKLAHYLAYSLLGILVATAWAARRPFTTRSFWALWGTVAIYGIVDELTQMLVEGRSAEVADWMADIAGVLTGLVVYRVVVASSRYVRRAASCVKPGQII